MSRGKRTCRILKEIRQRIADANDIEYITSECQYKGDCLGTCPKCEAEVRYLEAELAARRLAGKAVSIAGISIGMILGGCCDINSSNTTNIRNQVSTDTVKTSSTNKGGLIFDADISTEDLCVTGHAEPAEPEPFDPNRYYHVCDTMPIFPGGGEDSLQKYIEQHIVYPEEAKQKKLEGRVVIEMGIDTVGRVTKVKIIRSKDSIFNEEAVRVAKSLPRFKPGTINGKPINVYYTTLVYFRLKDK